MRWTRTFNFLAGRIFRRPTCIAGGVFSFANLYVSQFACTRLSIIRSALLIDANKVRPAGRLSKGEEREHQTPQQPHSPASWRRKTTDGILSSTWNCRYSKRRLSGAGGHKDLCDFGVATVTRQLEWRHSLAIREVHIGPCVNQGLDNVHMARPAICQNYGFD